MKYIIPGLIALLLFACSPEKENPIAEKYGEAINAGKIGLTAKHYCDAINAGNYVAFKELFDSRYQPLLTENMFRGLRPSSCSTKHIDVPYATIEYTSPGDVSAGEQYGSLYLLPNGKIKYDPIYIRHPALSLRGIVELMESEDLIFRQNAFKRMLAWNLPMFGFDPGVEPYTQFISIEQFASWVFENETTFDLTEPKLPLSPLDQERIR